jgi:hypothetical protein
MALLHMSDLHRVEGAWTLHHALLSWRANFQQFANLLSSLPRHGAQCVGYIIFIEIFRGEREEGSIPASLLTFIE